MTKYIYFDLGKVLLDFDHGLARKQVANLANIDESIVQDVIFDDGLLKQYETGQINNQRFHQLFCEATNTSTDSADFLRLQRHFPSHRPDGTARRPLAFGGIPHGHSVKHELRTLGARLRRSF